MQRVFRSTLVGLLTVAGLTACGDKVNVVAPQSPTVSSVVHSVTVSPNTIANLQVGSSVTLAASVDADAGVTTRTVTWSSSDATVASVDAGGKVTGVKSGTVTITAAATADPNVKGAAVVTVTPNAGTAIPTVTISQLNVLNPATGTEIPAQLNNVFGQLDVVLNVDANGGVLKTITATLKCGTDSLTTTQSVGSNLAPIAADAAAAPVTLSFPTAQFSAAGVAALHNGTCQVSAIATSASGTQSTAANSAQFTLNNRTPSSFRRPSPAARRLLTQTVSRGSLAA